MNTKTAIIIITHNRADKLERLIASVEKYTVDYNLYVLDNGTSNLYDIEKLKRIRESYKFSFFERSPVNLFPGQARNILFNNIANEELVVTLDDDMIVSPGWLEGLKWLIKQGFDAAGARIIQEKKRVIHSQGGTWKKEGEYLIFQEHLRGKPISRKAPLLDCNWLPSGCSLYKSYIIKEYKYDEELPNMEDPMHCYVLKQHGFRLASTDKCVVTHSHGQTANPRMRSRDNISKSIAIIHHKYGINVIKSWQMDKQFLSEVERRHIDIWLHNQKIKFGIIKGDYKSFPREPVRTQISANKVSASSLKNRKILSIVIPFRSRHQFLNSAINSIMRQVNIPWNNIEIIVTNLGGKSVSNFFELKEIRIDYNGVFNRAFALNVGAKLASSKNILFMDADVVLPKNFMDKLLQFAGIYSIINISTPDIDAEETKKILTAKVLNESRYSALLLKYNYKNSLLFVDRNVFLSMGGFDERYFGAGYEVKDFLFRGSKKYNIEEANNAAFSNKIAAFHLYHSSTVNTKEVILHNKEIFETSKKKLDLQRNVGRPWGQPNYLPIYKSRGKVVNNYGY